MKEEHEEEFKLPLPYIGMQIVRVLREKRISQNQFSEMLGKKEQAGKRILGKQHLHCEMLHKISVGLKHDFFQYYSGAAPAVREELARELVESKEKVAGLEEAMGQLEREMEFLRRENDYVNQINQLLEERKG